MPGPTRGANLVRGSWLGGVPVARLRGKNGGYFKRKNLCARPPYGLTFLPLGPKG